MTKAAKPSKEKLHAIYSASGSKRWLSCPGSINLYNHALATMKVVKGESSKWADEGTEAHECLETLLRNRADPGKTIQFLRKKYPAEMVIHAETALYEIMDLAGSMDAPDWLIEVKAELPVTEKDQFGTADVILVEEFGTLHVIDYKYGAGVAVFPENNSQGIYYALGVAHSLGYAFTDVKISIIQPRIPVGGKITHTWATTIDELHKWRVKFEQGIKATKAKDAPLRSGDHCQFCPTAVICPEISNRAIERARVQFAPESGELKVPESPKLIPIANLEKILPALDRIEDYISAVREHAFTVLKKGTPIKGFKLVEKRSTRKWTDAAKVEAEARKVFGARAYSAPELLSPAQMEKIKGEKVNPKEWVKKRVSNIAGGLTMAAESDKRQAVNPFAAFESEVHDEIVNDGW